MIRLSRIVWTALLVVVVWTIFGEADVHSRKLGLGVALGDPIGPSGKLWLGDSTALAGAGSFDTSRQTQLHLHVDYLLHRDLFDRLEARNEEGELLFYYGLGLKMRNQGVGSIDGRLPLGAIYLPREAPLDFYIEVVPTLNLAPSTRFDTDAGVGLRYYF